MRCRQLLLFLLPLLLGCPQRPSGVDAEFLRAMNLGKARLENKESAPAVEAFQRAVELAPDSAPALRNLARAHLLARDSDAALEALAKAAKLERESVATSYLTGLAYARESQFEDSVAYFEEAVRLDPDTAALRFQLAHAYQATRRDAQAVEQLRETVRLDPFHTTAFYRLARFALQAGDREEYEARNREMIRLRGLFGDDERSAEALETCVYTLAEPVAAVLEAPPAIAVRFTDTSSGYDLADAVTAAVLEVDEDGRYTLVAVGVDGSVHLLRPGGPAAPVKGPSLPPWPAEASMARVGNFYDAVSPGTSYDPELHARNDVLLLGGGGAYLLERKGPDELADVTAATGLSGLRGRRAVWVDYDHEGDLDLLVAGEALALWQNNGNATFTEVTGEVGLAADGAVDVAAVDLDGDVAVEVLVARGREPTRVYRNLRTGSFTKMDEPPGPWPAARRILVDDFDDDARPDALLVGAAEAVLVPGRGERRYFDLAGLEPGAAAQLDYDNDGRLDLLVAGTEPAAPGRGRLRLWHNDGAAGWSAAGAATGLDGLELPAVREIVAADLDTDGDSDLLLLTDAGPRFLRNDGGNANRQLKLRLVGTKTNPTGLGTRVELRQGGFLTSRAITALPAEVGVGARERLDTVLTVWTNGIVDNAIDVEVSAQPLVIVEKNVAAGSCPFLYAWDGEGFRFVTDLLGNSPLGLSLRRGVVLPADPDEIVYVGGEESFVPRDGAYVLQVTEEMREVLYLDEARLFAVDHASGVEVHATDKLAPPPFPPSELWALGSLVPPRAARGDDGVERGPALAALDGDFAPPGVALPPPLRGMTAPLVLTLDFGPLDAWRSPVLALTGWLQYGDASTNVALSQNPDVLVVAPRLEAETADGRWQPVDVVVGMPAGKTKTILVDLGGTLPPGVRRLRLTTSYEIRWDRIALGERLTADAVTLQALAPVASELGWHGFSDLRARAPGHPTTPRWEETAQRPPWRTGLRGWVTRYGDVLELTRERDARLALLHAGDALEMRFDAAGLRPVPPQRVRTFFFYSVGWDKDGDHNVVGGDTVDPLPVVSEDAGEWRLRYNTRWVPERPW